MSDLRRTDPRLAFAAVAAVAVAVTAGGIVAFSRQGSTPAPTPVRASPSPSATRIPMPTSASLSAASHDVVWALVADQNLYRSIDQGRTWQQRSLPQFVGKPEISFISENEGWLSAAGSPETQCNTQSVQIWHTVDAGASWQLLAAKGIADAECKAGLSFIDSTHGFIGTWSQLGRPVILLTTDGGMTWTASDPFPDPPAFFSQPGVNYFAAGRVRSFGNLLLVPVYAYGPQPTHQYVYFSNIRGGKTWGYNASAGTDGGTVAFISASHWVQLIGPGQSLETTNDGASWHASTSDYSQAAPVAPDVQFADGQVGYATVRGSIQVTVDGGRHWTYIKTPGT